LIYMQNNGTLWFTLIPPNEGGTFPPNEGGTFPTYFSIMIKILRELLTLTECYATGWYPIRMTDKP